MQKIISFETLEEAIMNKFLEKSTPANSILQKQYKSCCFKNLEFSGKGFFIDFVIPPNIPKIQNHLDLHANGKVNNINVGFILFVNNGILDSLEGFTYGEPWPDKITNYELWQEPQARK